VPRAAGCASGRLITSIGAVSTQTVSYGYDADGNRTSVKDALNPAATLAFDALNRLISVTNPLNGVVKYGYNAQHSLTSSTNPRNLTTSFWYDGFRRVIQASSPDTGTTVYHLDLAGNRISETDARHRHQPHLRRAQRARSRAFGSGVHDRVCRFSSHPARRKFRRPVASACRRSQNSPNGSVSLR
jgi:YD repeat-containing protein